MKSFSRSAQTLGELAHTHYENFPVASGFMPAKFREPVRLLYAFARVGDDIADEGIVLAEERLQALDDWQGQLHAVVGRGIGTKYFLDLAAAIRYYRLDISLFDDLIQAFRMDVRHAGFETYSDLLVYCRYSAHPVGRLMLQIFDSATERNCELSDALCAALQLANFWQDLLIDTRRGRLYVPVQDSLRFGVERAAWQAHTASDAVRALMRFQCNRTKLLFETGLPLLDLVPGSLRFELRLIWHGGMRIVRTIERQGYDTLSNRPTLSVTDKASVFIHAALHRVTRSQPR